VHSQTSLSIRAAMAGLNARDAVTPDMLRVGRSGLKRVCIPRSSLSRRLLEAKLAGHNWRQVASPEEPDHDAPAEGAPMMITARFMDGTGMSLAVHSNTTGHAVRAQLAQRLGIAEKRMKIIHGTGVLQGDRAVADQGVEDGAVLTVIMMQPICEGTEVYDLIADGYKHWHEEQLTDEQVRQGITDMTNKKMALHDALAAGGLLKRRL